MRSINRSIALYSFIICLFISVGFTLLSYFYVHELNLSLQMKEKHDIELYAYKITKTKQNLQDFKEDLFGTLESFLYKIAIIDTNGKILYSTFDKAPKIGILNYAIIEDGVVKFCDNAQFLDAGRVVMVLYKKIDYTSVKQKAYLLCGLILTFLLFCSIFLYIHTKKAYDEMSKNLALFLKDAIHEIRTPLGVLQINLEFLENTLSNSMPLKRAQGGLRNLTSIYENMEYLIKNKKIAYKKEWINLSELIMYRIEFFQILCDVKELEFTYHIDKMFLYANSLEIQRFIDNNISNAIKYTKQGRKINLNLEKTKFGATLSFENEGDEIVDTQKIFEQYHRGDNISGGFGLGLSMVKKICAKYKISIRVDSKNGLNKFSYNLPKTIIKELQ
ncbi:sensor histidine kinase [Campylobacter geochelonis]|uniref:histidine kinase n=1 Tax=Campylobacter geochelonis TaxID=1780362 RepID=A0A128EJ52_9BACT|nr:HAMP domain-containing sensor histidine kinase [Campylobacter geochelonis]QKF71393.1 two-component system sensor histidine kinase [Campylobacter geochelonis]CZE47724.1 two-component sensor [Campylobacter geochelonis]CZE48432.1 two-component sensor [Campylobacter geochelonis]